MQYFHFCGKFKFLVGMVKHRDFREGVIGISRGLVWLIVSVWIIVTAIVGLLRNAPIEELIYTIVIGGLVLFIAGNIISSMGVNFVVTSIMRIRDKRRRTRLEEFESLVAGKSEINPQGTANPTESIDTTIIEGEIKQ
jgi:hypothetical protein